MTLLTGRCESSKEISLSKAAKILSRFVSADNGAPGYIYPYLDKASKAFNELNRLHKDLKPSQSRRNNRQSHITTDNASGIRSSSVDVKSNQNDVKFNQQLNGSKHDENDKKKKLEFGNMKKVQNAKEQEQRKEIEKKISNNAKVENRGLGAPQELEIRSKKRNEDGSEKVNMQRDSNSKVENTKGQGQQKEVEKKLSNGVKSGGPMGSPDMEIRSKKKLEAGSEKKLYAEEVNTEKRKKRKNQDVEKIIEDRSGEHSKKMKRKHEG